MKAVFIILGSLFILSGCFSENSIKAQKEECIKEGKQFYTQEVLNFRSGKYETKGECK